jgi:23S rRNA (uracil1939-C5)-methyltransferase
VRNGPPGAVVRVRPFKRSKGVIHGRRTELIQAPPDAVVPRCEAFLLCGGCSLQELSLQAQREAKQQLVLEGVQPPEHVRVHPIRGTDVAYGYRNKVELSFGVRRYLSDEQHEAGLPIDGVFLGFHAPGRFDRVVDRDRCELVPEGLNEVLTVVRAHLAASEHAPWDVRAHTGFWKHLVLRETSLGQRLVAFYTAEPQGDEADELAAIAADLPVEGVLWFVNAGVADAAIGELRAQLKGGDTIEEALGEVRYELSATAFFQTNTAAARVLYDCIGEAAAAGTRLLDLYCGTGAIGLYLADRYERVLGVELNESAVEDARRNAIRNGREQVQILCGKVEETLPEPQPGDVAIVDPPRVGLHPKASAWLAQAPIQELVYVACHPASLGRDRLILEEGGWRMTDLWSVDLFPQTGHVEAIGRFIRPEPSATP